MILNHYDQVLCCFVRSRVNFCQELTGRGLARLVDDILLKSNSTIMRRLKQEGEALVEKQFALFDQLGILTHTHPTHARARTHTQTNRSRGIARATGFLLLSPS
jgi:hypothetical protein